MNIDTAAPLIGAPAPAFTLPRNLYQDLSLSELPGPAVLVFYPGDWEPISAEQLYRYQTNLMQLRPFEATLVAISVDSIWSHRAFADTLGLTFALLSDSSPRGRVSREYQVYEESKDRSRRAIFVVDAAGVVRWSRVSPNNLDPGVEGFLTALSKLDGARAPP
ncbi:MAG TPA: redoxin domain-containing protein [Chloroflexota bacterium]|nr:redoxin domain-containing protein [Chloroflexota bacterium]